MSSNPDMKIINGIKFYRVKRYKYNYNDSCYKMEIDDMELDKYLKFLNDIVVSKNAIDVLNSFTISDVNLKSMSVQYSLIYKDIFKGNIVNNTTNEVLKYINCKINPEKCELIKKTIIKIKLKINEMRDKRQTDEICAEWVGILSGLALYFDEYDITNFNKTNYLDKIMEPIIERDL